MRSVVTAAVFAFAALAPLAVAAPPPFRVLVVGTDLNKTGFNTVSYGYALQEAGLLDPRGKRLAIAGGNFVAADNTVVGKKIVVGQKEIGWYNATTNTAVVDINIGRLQDAFNLFSNADYGNQATGLVHIQRHGLTRQVKNGNVVTKKLGGGIYLDALGGSNQGRLYGGIGQATSLPNLNPNPALPTVDPYTLTVPNGVSVNVDLYSCYSGIPQAPGDGISVARSALSVNGIAATRGQITNHPILNEPVVQTLASPKFTVTNNPNNIDVAVIDAFLRESTDANGNLWKRQLDTRVPKNAANFLTGQPSVKHFQLVTTLPNQFVIPGPGGGAVTVEWGVVYKNESTLTPTGARGSPDPAVNVYERDFPITIERNSLGQLAGVVEYVDQSGHGLRSRVDFILNTVTGETQAGHTVHLSMASTIDVIEASAPPAHGLFLVSDIYSLASVGGQVLNSQGTWTLDIAPSTDLNSLQVFRFRAGVWEPLSYTILSPGSEYDRIGIDFTGVSFGSDAESFTIAAFAIPSPTAGTLMSLATLAALRRRRSA